MSFFLEPLTNKNKIEVELDLSNYATKSGLKTATDVDSSQFVIKDDLTNWKPDTDKLYINKFQKVLSSFNSLENKIDKLDVGKMKSALVDLKKLSGVVGKEVVKKIVYDKLVEKFNVIDTSKLVNKTDYNAKIKDIPKCPESMI